MLSFLLDDSSCTQKIEVISNEVPEKFQITFLFLHNSFLRQLEVIHQFWQKSEKQLFVSMNKA